MTQYQGPVTVYQRMEARPETLSSIAGCLEPVRTEDNLTGNLETPLKLSTKGAMLRRWGIITMIVILVGILIGVFIVLENFDLKPINTETVVNSKIQFSNQYDADTIPTLSNGHLIINRHQWGARTSNVTFVARRLLHPIPHVIVTHIGSGSRPCHTVYNCSVKMRTIQDSAIAKKGLDDMNANFYVSNDGYVYVGRGWEIQNVYTTRSIAVCFMGDYSRNEPTPKQLNVVQYLLEFGITHKNLQVNYQIVAHNQTKITKSPGANVYKHIVKWPHWHSGCGVGEKPLCHW